MITSTSFVVTYGVPHILHRLHHLLLLLHCSWCRWFLFICWRFCSFSLFSYDLFFFLAQVRTNRMYIGSYWKCYNNKYNNQIRNEMIFFSTKSMYMVLKWIEEKQKPKILCWISIRMRNGNTHIHTHTIMDNYQTNRNKIALCVLCNPEFQNSFNIIRKPEFDFNGQLTVS